MGQALEVFLVPEAEMRRIPGGHGPELLANLLHENQQNIRNLDEHFADAYEDEEDRPLSMGQAIAEILAGSFTRPEDYPVYAYAFEAICDHFGEWLPNSGFCPCSVDLYTTLDADLARHGVPLRMVDLIQRPPVPLPDDTCDGYLIGHWTAEEMRRAGPLLATVLAGGADVHPALQTVERWLQKAAGESGKMLIGFHG